MYGSGGTSLALHLNHLNGLSKEILASECRPFVHVLSHWRRRSDRIDCCKLTEKISYVSSCLVSVAGQKHLFFTHDINKLYALLLFFQALKDSKLKGLKQRYLLNTGNLCLCRCKFLCKTLQYSSGTELDKLVCTVCNHLFNDI